MLWCDGGDDEKVVELYDMLQDNNQKSISATDKDFSPVMRTIFDLAGYILYQNESWVSDKKYGELTMTEEEIVIMRGEEGKYDEVCEEFIDKIFEFESKLDREEFEKLVIEKQKWIFNTNDIRKNIGWK